MSDKKPLEPLIPLDDLKQVLAKIVAAPKGEMERPKRKRLAAQDKTS